MLPHQNSEARLCESAKDIVCSQSGRTIDGSHVSGYQTYDIHNRLTVKIGAHDNGPVFLLRRRQRKARSPLQYATTFEIIVPNYEASTKVNDVDTESRTVR